MIRPARATDSGAIAAVWNPFIRDTAVTFNSVEKTEDEVRRLIADRPCTFVADEAGVVAGFVTYGQFRSGIGYAHTLEHTILVSDTARGQGLGRQLMQAAVDHARSGGAHSLWAGVSAENPAGIAFHERIGFTRIATLPEVGYKFGRWMDLVLLQKRL